MIKREFLLTSIVRNFKLAMKDLDLVFTDFYDFSHREIRNRYLISVKQSDKHLSLPSCICQYFLWKLINLKCCFSLLLLKLQELYSIHHLHTHTQPLLFSIPVFTRPSIHRQINQKSNLPPVVTSLLAITTQLIAIQLDLIKTL